MPRSPLSSGPLVALAFAAQVGCGAIVIDPDAASGDVGAEASGDAADGSLPDGPDARCRVLDAPICTSSECPSPCSAAACLQPRDPASLTPMLPGVCGDRDTHFTGGGVIPCTVCLEASDVCLYTPYMLVCVPPAVCSAFKPVDGSSKTACLYLDKTPWSPGDRIAGETPCPAGAAALGVCGGLCPTCPVGSVCTGVSANSPFGICALPRVADSKNQCAVDWKCTGGQACLTFAVGDAVLQGKADSYGFCLEAARCTGIRALMPGRIRCN